MKQQKPKYKRNISQLFQDSQKSTNKFVNMVGHAMKHILGNDKPPTDILSVMNDGLIDFKNNRFLIEEYILIREIERKMNVSIELYIKQLNEYQS